MPIGYSGGKWVKPATTTAESGIKPETVLPNGSEGHPELASSSGPDNQQGPAYKRVAWFVLIWLCSVGVLAIVAGLIRWVIKP
jgi:hypothetical protein